MKTYLRRTFFRVAIKCVFAIISSAVAAGLTLAQTNTFPSSGNAGVGTTAPLTKVHAMSANTTSTSVIATTDSSGNTGSGLGMWSGWSGGTPNHPALIWTAGRDLRFGGGITDLATGGGFSETMRITSSGRVGIGTATPDTWAKLHVYNADGAGIDIQSATAGQWSRVRLVTGTRIYGWFAGDSTNSLAPNKIGLYDYTASAFRMMVDSSGNVGFGTSSPALQTGTTNKMLEVQGSVNPGIALTATSAGGRQFYLYSSQTNPGYLSFFDATAGADRLVVSSGGNVGIGTASPQSSLQLGSQTSASTATPTTLSLGGSYSSVAGSNLKLRLYDDGVLANVYGIGTSANSMDFGVSSTAGYHWYSGGSNKMTLSSSGDLSVTGNIAAKYQDLAEWVPSSEQLAPGTVVVLDSTKSNQVVASAVAYDTRVAGVISERPGIALGENGEGKVLVATTGRVRVKVDATRAPIQIGDLLVTSDMPGVAMKSEPIVIGGRKLHSPGTLIGKALEPLANGQGEILVLLSLQ
jgi:hypothetical protein